MANEEHLTVLRHGVDVWNKWRDLNPDIHLDLSEADLRGVDLRKANLFKADLRRANLFQADLRRAILIAANIRAAHLSESDLGEAYLSGVDFSGAYLSQANLSGTYLAEADLSGADLRRAKLYTVDLSGANLSGANLSGADLSRSSLVEANLEKANLTECSVYGTSAWNVRLEGSIQSSLVISRFSEPLITVDNLEVAQFIYLLLNNERIRSVIDTISRKVVLILGRFTPERKLVLDALREALRRHNYLPVLFDFERPENRDFTETVRTLATMARFILADLTSPRTVPQELQAIVPDLAVPVQPLLDRSVDTREWAVIPDFWKYTWVLPTHRYADLPDLLAALGDLIAAAEAKATSLTEAKARAVEEWKRLGG